MNGTTVTLDELARILGKSRHFLLDRLRAGMPCAEKGGRGRAYRFNSGEAIAWIAARPSVDARRKDPASAEASRRYWAAKADLKEMELAEQRSQLISVDRAATILADELAPVRSRILAIPGRLAPALARMKDSAEIEAAIRDEVVGALTELTCG